MGNKFDKLIAAVNAISQGKPTVKPGKFCVDHYEKDWRALLASSLQAAQSVINWARVGYVCGTTAHIEGKGCFSVFYKWGNL